MATAYITLLLVFIYYARGNVASPFLNTVDHAFLYVLWRNTFIKPSAGSGSVLEKAVLMFSDTQIVTGIALLVSGYTQMKGGIDVYHWQILVYLVWFSSLTHLTTLTVLRQYFRSNPAVRSWRAFLMLATVIMLGVALLPTGDFFWIPDLFGAVPVKCYYLQLAPRYAGTFAGSAAGGDVPLSTMIVSVLILFYGYATRFVKLSSGATDLARYWLRIVPGRLWKGWIDKCDANKSPRSTRLSLRFFQFLLEVIHTSLHAYYEIYESMLWEVNKP